jgi:rubrerythrin
MPAIAIEYITTVQNLQAAFEGESNAHSRYAAFALRADADRLDGVASLFRAAARAEQIHAANHARVMRQLGSEAVCTIHPVEAGNTLDNLMAALSSELDEKENLYPGFIAEAAAHNLTAAVRTFTGALEAEKTHARLYGRALALLQEGKRGWRISTAREFYVCPVCGYTSETEEEHEHCPVCNCAWEKFEIVR